MTLGYDTELPAGYQDADIEMMELAAAADEASDDDDQAQPERLAVTDPKFNPYGGPPLAWYEERPVESAAKLAELLERTRARLAERRPAEACTCGAAGHTTHSGTCPWVFSWQPCSDPIACEHPACGGEVWRAWGDVYADEWGGEYARQELRVADGPGQPWAEHGRGRELLAECPAGSFGAKAVKAAESLARGLASGEWVNPYDVPGVSGETYLDAEMILVHRGLPLEHRVTVERSMAQIALHAALGTEPQGGLWAHEVRLPLDASTLEARNAAAVDGEQMSLI